MTTKDKTSDNARTEARRHGRAVDIKEICTALGCSRDKVYTEIKKGHFAKPMKFGARMSRWFESDIDDYLDRKLSEARA